MNLPFFDTFLLVWAGLAVFVFALLFFITVPYGRHTRKGWGPTLDPGTGWLIMEAPSALVFALWFLLGAYSRTPAMIVFFLMWEMHYAYRAFVYPLRMRGDEHRMPALISGFAFLFNSINSTMNGLYLFSFSGGYPVSWFRDVRFVAGALLFLLGYAINRHADAVLLNLRKDGTKEYRIPHGGLYRWISSPNYFGEIIEWVGWAVATWSLPGAVFALWTVANLAPRARANHRWYRNRFGDYPAKRRALIPFVW